MLQAAYLIIGALTGTAAGLLPGLHTNNIAPVIISLPIINPELFIFTAAAASSFTVSSSVPSILLGAPSGENMVVLPGHKLTNIGKGMTAVHLTLKGTLTSIILTPIVAACFILLAPTLYGPISSIFPFLLILITLAVIKKPQALIITALSALVGLTTLTSTTIMPMLTGFFGTSTLLIALNREEEKTIQRKEVNSKTSLSELIRVSALSTALSTFFGLIPAVSSAVTAVAGKAFGKMNEEEYLSFIGASNTTYVTVSFLALLYLGKARSGATAALAATRFPLNPFMTVLVLMTASSVAYVTIQHLLPKIINLMNKINHKKITVVALTFLITLNIILTNETGLIVLLTCTMIGIATVRLKVSRINCMASLTIPTALLLL